MPDLTLTQVAAIACHASEGAIDAVVAAVGASACRVAPDEALLLGRPGEATKIVTAVSKKVTALDDDAVVLDATDGWTMWTLEGDDAREAFARLSAVPLPDEGFTQGDVGHVPVKVLVREERIHLVVPAMWGAFLRERILDVGLPARERPEPAAWSGPTAKRRGAK